MEDSRSPEVAIREPEQIRSACSCKLRRVKSGPYFKAILACLLGEEWGRPRIMELRVDADHGLHARLDGDVNFKQFTGKECDLIRSILRTGKAARLDGDEIGYLLAGIARIKAPRRPADR
ncbi:MAG: hypothetical protein ACLQNE_40400 [Thermoguttaceae bacterium]